MKILGVRPGFQVGATASNKRNPLQQGVAVGQQWVPPSLHCPSRSFIGGGGGGGGVLLLLLLMAVVVVLLRDVGAAAAATT
jgi:hypothetical protein